VKRKRKRSIVRKVRKLRKILGGRKPVVHFMGAASTTSLKRWENKECEPLRAHVQIVDKTYDLIKNSKIEILIKRIQKQKKH
jgi:hypothetical protein